MTRLLVVWWPDWPAVAAGLPVDQPVAVLHANRVVAASQAARLEGIRPGQRRRVAQACCPGVEVVDHDPALAARAFEPLVQALEALAPRWEVERPGTCACTTQGPSRYWGGDEALAARALHLASERLGDRLGVAGAPGVGVADGWFTAGLAARHGADVGRAVVVASGDGLGFLAPLPVRLLADRLDDPDLVELLPRLGLATLGAVAALPAGAMGARFGPDGVLAHRLASATDDRLLVARRPPPEFAVEQAIDPPAERVEQVGFVAKALADRLHGSLAAQGLACSRVLVELETEHAEHHSRVWRTEGSFRPAAIAERARWQLDGWLTGPAAPTAGVTLLRLVPEEVIPDDGRQLGFWGGQTAADERAQRGVARLGELVGREAVLVAERRGGRGPAEQLVLVPADTVDLAERLETPLAGTAPVGTALAGTALAGGSPAGGSPVGQALPWPGQVPRPAPAIVHDPPLPASLVDAAGVPVTVTGRGVIAAGPVAVVIGGGRPQAVEAWAGPWCYEERWWDPAAARRRARLQVCTAGGEAYLLACEHGHWWVEAAYD